MKSSNRKSLPVNLLQDEEILSDSNSTNRKKKSSQSLDKQDKARLFTKFQKFFDEVKDIKVDFGVALEFFNLKLASFPTNQEVFRFQKKQLQSRTAKQKSNWTSNEVKVFIWVLMKYRALYQVNITQLTEKNCSDIAEILINRDTEVVRQKWLSLLKQKLVDVPFTKYEDDRLLYLYDQYKNQGYSKIWAEIAKDLNKNNEFYRTSKQLRERYINYLDPNLNNLNQKWTDSDDLLLIKQIIEKGRKWAEIAKIFKRNENQVKNRFNSLLKRENIENEDLSQLRDKLLWKQEALGIQNFSTSSYQKLNSSNILNQFPSNYIHLKIGHFEALEEFQKQQLTTCLVDLKNNIIYFTPLEMIQEVMNSNLNGEMKDDFARIKMELEKFSQQVQSPIWQDSLSMINEEVENMPDQLLCQSQEQFYYKQSLNSKQMDSFQFIQDKQKLQQILRYNRQKYIRCKTEFIIFQQAYKYIYRSLPQCI